MTKQPLTDERREELRQLLDNLEEASSDIVAAMEPFRKALTAIGDVEEHLMDIYEAGGYVAGKCEACDRLLLEGDMGMSDADSGVQLCEEHAPTIADCLKNWQQALDSDDVDQGECKEMIKHFQSGVDDGRGDEIVVHEL